MSKSISLQKKKRLISFLIILLLVCVILIGSTLIFYQRYGLKYYKEIKIISNDCSVDAKLVMSVCFVESSFRSNCISKANAVGMMQIMPSTAEWLCDDNDIVYNYDDLFKVDYNVKIGCLYLRYLLDRFSFDWAIIAYNAGETNVRYWIGKNLSPSDVPYKESREYLQKVTRAYSFYSKVLLNNVGD